LWGQALSPGRAIGGLAHVAVRRRGVSRCNARAGGTRVSRRGMFVRLASPMVDSCGRGATSEPTPGQRTVSHHGPRPAPASRPARSRNRRCRARGGRRDGSSQVRAEREHRQAEAGSALDHESSVRRGWWRAVTANEQVSGRRLAATVGPGGNDAYAGVGTVSSALESPRSGL